MGEKDIVSKQIIKRLVRDFATYLFGLPVSEVELAESSHERVEDRHADLVAKVRQGDGTEFLPHIEITGACSPSACCATLATCRWNTLARMCGNIWSI